MCAQGRGDVSADHLQPHHGHDRHRVRVPRELSLQTRLLPPTPGLLPVRQVRVLAGESVAEQRSRTFIAYVFLGSRY